MNLALFGGTFDPAHRGHMAVLRAVLADPRFHLDEVVLIPAGLPPHKQDAALTSYPLRLRMLELALQELPEEVRRRLRISRIEEQRDGAPAMPSYSIHTVREFKKTLSPEDTLYFIVGLDSFLGIAKWREPEALLAECAFIVVSRPGYSMGNALAALPASLAAGPENLMQRVFLLEGVDEDISSTSIRDAVRTGIGLEDHVGPRVAGFIREHGLYR